MVCCVLRIYTGHTVYLTSFRISDGKKIFMLCHYFLSGYICIFFRLYIADNVHLMESKTYDDKEDDIENNVPITKSPVNVTDKLISDGIRNSK